MYLTLDAVMDSQTSDKKNTPALATISNPFSDESYKVRDKGFFSFYINSSTKSELMQSAISADIAKINFESVDPDNGDGENLEILVQHYFQFVNPERTNSGMLTKSNYNKISHFRDGGFICRGCDPLNGFMTSEWGQIKPVTQKVYFDKKKNKEKSIKYVSPAGGGTARIYYPQISAKAWDKIAQKHKLEIVSQKGDSQSELNYRFWSWVATNKIQVLITEGHKKACSLICAGYPAIALPGIWQFSNKEKNGLKDDLLIWDNHSFCIVFDHDYPGKKNTINDVKKATRKLAGLLSENGHRVTTIWWNHLLGKGCDDIIALQGEPYFDELMSKQRPVLYTVEDTKWTPEGITDQEYQNIIQYQEDREFELQELPKLLRQERYLEWQKTAKQANLSKWLRSRYLTPDVDIIDWSINKLNILNWLGSAYGNMTNDLDVIDLVLDQLNGYFSFLSFNKYQTCLSSLTRLKDILSDRRINKIINHQIYHGFGFNKLVIQVIHWLNSVNLEDYAEFAVEHHFECKFNLNVLINTDLSTIYGIAQSWGHFQEIQYLINQAVTDQKYAQEIFEFFTPQKELNPKILLSLIESRYSLICQKYQEYILICKKNKNDSQDVNHDAEFKKILNPYPSTFLSVIKYGYTQLVNQLDSYINICQDRNFLDKFNLSLLSQGIDEQVGFFINKSPSDAISSNKNFNAKFLLNFLCNSDIKAVKEECKYFNYYTPAPNEMVFVKSGLGTGKTYWLSKIVAEIDKRENNGWLFLGHRNKLLFQMVRRLNAFLAQGHKLSHLHKDSAYDQVRDPQGKLALCVDSLHHFKEDAWLEDKWIVIDEINSVLSHALYESNLGKKHQLILDKLTHAIKHCRGLIALDGNLNDDVVSYIKTIRSDIKITVVNNSYQHDKLNFVLLEGVVNESDILELDSDSSDEGEIPLIIKNDRAPLVQAILDAPRPFITVDSRKEGEALFEMLSARGKKGILVTSKTCDDKETEQFLEFSNTDSYWIDNKYDFFIGSPSVDAGIDVNIRNYFTDSFCLFFGVVKTDSQLQMGVRLRDPNVPRYIWCKNKGFSEDNHNNSFFEKTIAKNYNDIIMSDGFLALVNKKELTPEEEVRLLQEVRRFINTNESVHYQYFRKLSARCNYEKTNLKQCLITALREAGHNIETRTFVNKEEYRAIMTELSDTKEMIADMEANQIFKAEDISIEQARSLADSFSSTWEDRCKVKKAFLKYRLPGIQHTEVWNKDLFKTLEADNYNLIQQSEMLYWVKNPAIARHISQLRWFKVITHQKTFLPHTLKEYVTLRAKNLPEEEISVRCNFLRIWTLISCGIEHFLNPENKWMGEDDEVLAFAARCSKRENALAIGLTPGNGSPIRFLHQVLKKYFGLKCGVVETLREGTDRVSYYGITNWDDPIRKTVADLIGAKLSNIELYDLNWSNLLNSETLDVNRKMVVEDNLGDIKYTLSSPIQKENLSLPNLTISYQAGDVIQVWGRNADFKIKAIGPEKVLVQNLETSKLTFVEFSDIETA